jgi:hypothetical protein
MKTDELRLFASGVQMSMRGVTFHANLIMLGINGVLGTRILLERKGKALSATSMSC